MRIFYVALCVLLIVSITGCAASCNKASASANGFKIGAKSGPTEPTICFDKQWDKNIEFSRPVFFEDTKVTAPWGEEIYRDWPGLPEGTPVYEISASSSMYAYPPSLVHDSSGVPRQVYLYPLSVDRIRPEGYLFTTEDPIDVLIEDDGAEVGGTKQEPKTAVKYMIRVPPGKMPSSGLFVLSDPSGGVVSRYALVRLK